MKKLSSKTYKKRTLWTLILSFIALLSYAQQTGSETAKHIQPQHGIELGYNHEIFSLADYSVYLGYNRSYPVTKHIHLDIQTGLSHAKYTGYNSFFSRLSSNKWTASSYIGFKTYFNSASHKVRMYALIMAGGHLQADFYEDTDREDTIIPSLGLSYGLMGEYKNIYGGIVSERGLYNLIAKLGYRF